jgi:hypothetical protein
MFVLRQECSTWGTLMQEERLMALNQNSSQDKQSDQARQFADATKANLNRTADQAARAADVARDGLRTITNLHEQAAETSKQLLQNGVEVAAKQAREASDRLTRTLGFSGEGSEDLVRQSKQNMEAVTRCGTVLGQALQDASRGWFELAQKQWQRNLDGLTKLARSTSVQEFTAVQSDLIREGMQQIVQDGRRITETSLRAVDEASKAFPGTTQQNSSQGTRNAA